MNFYKEILIMLFTFLAVTSCTSPQKNVKDLIRPWSHKLSEEESYKYPFIAGYRKNEFQLNFIATKHSNHVESFTFKTINKFLSENDPDLVILEPFSYDKGVSPKFFQDYSSRCSKIDFKKCDEASYTVWLIKDKKIPFIGGEPSDLSILNNARKSGFKDEDIVFFYTLRQIPQLTRQGRQKSLHQDQISLLLKVMAKRLGIKTEMIFSNLEKWYENKNNRKFKIKDIDTEIVAPYGDKGSLFTQKISHNISLYRDQFVVDLIKQKASEYKNILVVYGGSHHTKQKLALEKLFGPTDFKKYY